MMAVALPTICAENPTAEIESDSLELLSDVCSSDIELSVSSSQLSIGSVDSGMDISDSGTDDELSLPSNSESDTESSTGSERIQLTWRKIHHKMISVFLTPHCMKEPN